VAVLDLLLKLPLFRRLSLQVAATALLLLVSALSAFGGLAYSLAARDLESELGLRLVDAAGLCALGLADGPLPRGVPGPEESARLRARLARLAAAGDLERLLLLDGQGRVLGDSLGQAVGSDPYVYLALDAGEWRAALRGRAESTTLFRGGGGRYFKSAFAPLPAKGPGPLWIVRAEASAAFLDKLRELGMSLALLGLLSLLLALALAMVLARPLVLPLRALIAASGRVAGGDFTARVVEGRSDELGQLAVTFNDMAGRLGTFVRQRERLAALGEVAAGMAHEIRNPLAAIEGFSSLAEAALKREPSQAAARLRDLRREVAVANAFIDDFLEYARPRPPRLLPCDLGAVAGEAAALAMGARRRRGVSVIRRGLKGLRAAGDAGQLRQILLNLLGNAMEASAKDGVVELGLGRRGAEALLWVRDRGKGIAPGDLQGLFKPFVTSKPMGTGLGLSIAQKLAEGMGGSIEVRSVEGQGSTFTLHLPLDRARRRGGGGPAGATKDEEGLGAWHAS
jgi:signal transduction histidine kinase